MKAAAAAADVVRRPEPGLVVLIYHRVGRRTSVEVDLPLDLFEAQIRLLAEECHVVTLEDGLRFLGSAEPAPQRSVAVTFDDGTADFADLAVPVLARFGVPATLYAATHFIDTGEAFPDQGAPLSWAALRDACSTGVVTVGSHTHRHALLDRLPAGEVADELDRSIDLLGEHLGAAPEHFAYPKAVLGSPAAQEQVRGRFRSAALAGTGREPVRALGPLPARALARAGERRDDLVRQEGTRRHGVGGLVAPPAEPASLRRRHHLTVQVRAVSVHAWNMSTFHSSYSRSCPPRCCSQQARTGSGRR